MRENKYVGTETEKNLKVAFSGESEARNKYTYFAPLTPLRKLPLNSFLFLFLHICFLS